MTQNMPASRPWRSEMIIDAEIGELAARTLAEIAAEGGILHTIAQRIAQIEERLARLEDALPRLYQFIEMRPDRTYLMRVEPELSEAELNRLVDAFKYRGLDVVIIQAELVEVARHARQS